MTADLSHPEVWRQHLCNLSGAQNLQASFDYDMNLGPGPDIFIGKMWTIHTSVLFYCWLYGSKVNWYLIFSAKSIQNADCKEIMKTIYVKERWLINNITVKDKTLITNTAKIYRKILACVPNGMKPINTLLLYTISAVCAFIVMWYPLDRKTVPPEFLRKSLGHQIRNRLPQSP